MNQKNPFKEVELTDFERLLEYGGILMCALVFIGSFLKVVFL